MPYRILIEAGGALRGQAGAFLVAEDAIPSGAAAGGYYPLGYYPDGYYPGRYYPHGSPPAPLRVTYLECEFSARVDPSRTAARPGLLIEATVSARVDPSRTAARPK